MNHLAGVTVVVPALDEAETIVAVVAALRDQGLDRVIVVNNGSTDATAARAAAAGAVVVDEPRRGYGFACAAGTKQALAGGSSVVAYIDADLSSDPVEIGRLVDPIVSGTADLVLGSRTLGTIESGAMPIHQRWGNRVTAAIMRLIYAVDITDLGPFRAIDARLLVRLEMSEMTFGWPVEMMVKSARAGGRIIELPVTWSHRRGGNSKVGGTIKGSILAGWFILRVTLRYARWSPARSNTHR